MFKLLALCLVAVIVSSAQAKDGRIVNGRIIDIKNAPYAVQLRRFNNHFCGGTLVTPTIVVTAAHCMDTYGKTGLEAVGGANTKDEAGIARKVINFSIPDGYSRETGMNMDISVLKLESPMTGGVVKTLPLTDEAWKAGKKVQVSGWGRLASEGEKSEVLRTVYLDTIPQADCLKKNIFPKVGAESKECATGENQDSCQGDSGGPAVIDGKLAGVVSSGRGCANPRFPGVYTSIFTMRDFISNAMKTL